MGLNGLVPSFTWELVLKEEIEKDLVREFPSRLGVLTLQKESRVRFLRLPFVCGEDDSYHSLGRTKPLLFFYFMFLTVR